MKSYSIHSKSPYKATICWAHNNDLMTKIINASDKIGKIYPSVAVATTKKAHLTRSTEVHRITKLSQIELDYKTLVFCFFFLLLFFCLFWFWFLYTDANSNPLVPTTTSGPLVTTTKHNQNDNQNLKPFVIFIRTTARIK